MKRPFLIACTLIGFIVNGQGLKLGASFMGTASTYSYQHGTTNYPDYEKMFAPGYQLGGHVIIPTGETWGLRVDVNYQQRFASQSHSDSYNGINTKTTNIYEGDYTLNLLEIPVLMQRELSNGLGFGLGFGYSKYLTSKYSVHSKTIIENTSTGEKTELDIINDEGNSTGKYMGSQYCFIGQAFYNITPNLAIDLKVSLGVWLNTLHEPQYFNDFSSTSGSTIHLGLRYDFIMN